MLVQVTVDIDLLTFIQTHLLGGGLKAYKYFYASQE